VLVDPLLFAQGGDEADLFGLTVGPIQVRSEVRNAYVNSRARVSGYLEPRHVCVADWLFNVEHAPALGGSRQQMLRALEHEVPSQVREAEYVVVRQAAG
jgi:hypothetical protein